MAFYNWSVQSPYCGEILLMWEHCSGCADDYFPVKAVGYCKLQNKRRRLFRELMTQGFHEVLCWDYPSMLKSFTATFVDFSFALSCADNWKIRSTAVACADVERREVLIRQDSQKNQSWIRNLERTKTIGWWRFIIWDLEALIVWSYWKETLYLLPSICCSWF